MRGQEKSVARATMCCGAMARFAWVGALIGALLVLPGAISGIGDRFGVGTASAEDSRPTEVS